MEGYLKLKLFAFWFLLAGLIFLCVLAISTHSCVRSAPHAETRTDTVIVRDTIRESLPVIKTVPVVRIDTAKLALVTAQRDSLLEAIYTTSSNPGTDFDAALADSAAVVVPIEQKTYQTDNYRAVIEGFRPELVSMEIYRQTQYIDRVQMTPDTRRWGLGLQAGYGLSVQNGNVKAYPYVGVGVQYSLFRW